MVDVILVIGIDENRMEKENINFLTVANILGMY